MNKPTVCISILTYNNFIDTAECLQSLKELQDNFHTTIVIDNGSTDDSIERLNEAFPNQIIIKLPTNIGVPAGFNEGILWALKQGFEYVFLLNNDTLVQPDILSKLVQFQQNHENCGMVMPRVIIYPKSADDSRKYSVWSDGGYFRKFPPSIVQKDNRKKIDFNQARKIEFAPACGILLPCSTFLKVGLFDPIYFFFYEDWDYSIRIREAGLDIWHLPSAQLWHKVSKTTKKNDALYWYTMGNSMMKFYRRHFSLLSSLFQVCYIIFRDLILKGNIRYCKPYLRGIIQGLHSEIGDYPNISDYLSLQDRKVME